MARCPQIRGALAERWIGCYIIKKEQKEKKEYKRNLQIFLYFCFYLVCRTVWKFKRLFVAPAMYLTTVWPETFVRAPDFLGNMVGVACEQVLALASTHCEFWTHLATIGHANDRRGTGQPRANQLCLPSHPTAVAHGLPNHQDQVRWGPCS